MGVPQEKNAAQPRCLALYLDGRSAVHDRHLEVKVEPVVQRDWRSSQATSWGRSLPTVHQQGRRVVRICVVAELSSLFCQDQARGELLADLANAAVDA
ncbi:MAG: hypothetical protein ACI9MC_002509 [Kiritimatiellia bacterium]|jgi:hypothetical protein